MCVRLFVAFVVVVVSSLRLGPLELWNIEDSTALYTSCFTQAIFSLRLLQEFGAISPVRNISSVSGFMPAQGVPEECPLWPR